MKSKSWYKIKALLAIKIDILFNNVGISVPFNDLDILEVSDRDTSFNVNLESYFLLAYKKYFQLTNRIIINDVSY